MCVCVCYIIFLRYYYQNCFGKVNVKRRIHSFAFFHTVYLHSVDIQPIPNRWLMCTYGAISWCINVNINITSIHVYGNIHTNATHNYILKNVLCKSKLRYRQKRQNTSLSTTNNSCK